MHKWTQIRRYWKAYVLTRSQMFQLRKHTELGLKALREVKRKPVMDKERMLEKPAA